MSSVSALAIPVHALAALAWVGGMFFAYVVLRPAAAGLETPERLTLWKNVFERFFPWVWAAVFLLPMTGFWTVQMDMGGFRNAGLHVHIMNGVGMLMIGLFVYLYGSIYRRFADAVAESDWPAAGLALGRIRHVVGVNLVLGVFVIVVATSGRFW